MAENEKILRLIPMEGSKEERIISLEVAKISLTLKEVIESTEDEEQPYISLPIPVQIIDKIIAFLEYHFDDPIEDIDTYLDDNAMQQMSQWDRHLMKDLTVDKIFTVIAIADYLQIKGLKDVCKKTIDSKIKDLNDKQIKQLSQMRFQSVSENKCHNWRQLII